MVIWNQKKKKKKQNQNKTTNKNPCCNIQKQIKHHPFCFLKPGLVSVENMQYSYLFGSMPYTRSNRISLKSPPPSSELARNTMLIAESEGWLTTLPAQRDSESCSSCSKNTDHSLRAHVPVVWSPGRVSTRFTSVPFTAVPYGTSGLRWSSPSLHNRRHLTPTEAPGCLAGTALAACCLGHISMDFSWFCSPNKCQILAIFV